MLGGGGTFGQPGHPIYFKDIMTLVKLLHYTSRDLRKATEIYLHNNLTQKVVTS
jgi:hypothetical protein